jgi:hypothetical protein
LKLVRPEHFEIVPANLSTLYGIRDAVAYDALSTNTRVTRLLPAGYDPLLHTSNPIFAPEEVPRLAELGVRFILSRGDVAGATRVGRLSRPCRRRLRDAGAIPRPLPPNQRPPRLPAGIVITVLAILGSVVWLRLYRSIRWPSST